MKTFSFKLKDGTSKSTVSLCILVLFRSTTVQPELRLAIYFLTPVFSPWFVNHVKLHAVAIQQVYVSIGEPMSSYCSTFWCACDNIESTEQVHSDIVAHSLALCWGISRQICETKNPGGPGGKAVKGSIEFQLHAGSPVSYIERPFILEYKR